jgi:predicted O-methyltransferase YrrM
MGVLGDHQLQSLIERLQAQSLQQTGELGRYFSQRMIAGDLDWGHLDDGANKFLADKMVALEPVKAEFCYMLCLSLRAKRIVEVGSSYGVSTLYLAAAIRDNENATGTRGVVIATEYEPAKAAAARTNYKAAALTEFIDLREGDLRETLKVIEGPVDFVLMDIWTEMVMPAIRLIAPHLRPGSVIVADNTEQFAEAYRDYFEYVRNPMNRMQTMTLPFEGGLELTVKL